MYASSSTICYCHVVLVLSILCGIRSASMVARAGPPLGCGDPGTGDCFEPGFSPYCEDVCGGRPCPGCCKLVCAADPFCCDEGVGSWDAFCVGEAKTICSCDPKPCGASDDCNDNDVPDECDLDCDAKDVQCDPKTCGKSEDCNLNGVPDECEFAPPVLFVDDTAEGANNGSSWDDALTDLQVALCMAANSAGAISEVWVAQGTYAPSEQTDPKDPRTATFQLQDGLALYGGFAGFESTLEERVGLFDQTILTGDLTGDDVPFLCKNDSECDGLGGLCVEGACIIESNNAENSYHVTIGSGTDLTAILDGFAIKGGNANSGNPDDSGAGMINISGGPTVTACIFTANAAAIDGGGMANFSGSSPTLTNCTFSGNAATFGGGMKSTGSSPTVTNCTFSENRASSYGGGMVNFNLSGSAVSGCTFIGNIAVLDGGGMRNQNIGNLTVINCTFSGNSATFGGGMQNRNASLSVTGCTFIGNSATSGGGGVTNILGSDPEVTNCTFSGNSAVSGGGMYNDNSSPAVTSCSFSGNSAASTGGGMVNLDVSSPTVTDCTFTANTAVNDGGGMRNNDNSSPAVTGCTFSGNSAAFGGGMHNESSSSPQVTNCTFSGNMANTFAGGGMRNRNSSSPHVTNCTFTGNSAATFGGGMANLAFSNPTVTNCTFNANSAEDDGGGMRNEDNSISVIANSIFWGNTDLAGTNMDETAQISSDGTSSATVNYSDIQGLTGALGGLGNLGLDPMFFDPDGPDDEVGTEDDNLRLLHGSPAIDSGQNSAVPPDAPDLDGDEDTDEPIPFDLDGEARFVDDMLAPDCPQADKDPKVDCGIAPIVDMGAYEFEPDCDGNEIPDKCDNDCGEEGGPCDVPGCGQIVDCNGNGIPDACDIADCPPDTPLCDDCNLNGVPDGCDIESGFSEDVDPMDGVPDECVQVIEGDANWTDDIWDIPGKSQYPDNEEGNPNGEPDLHVTISGEGTVVFLDETVATDSLRIGSGATMEVTQTAVGDFTLEDPGGLLVEGNLLVANDRMIDVTAGAVTIGVGGVYQADPAAKGPVSAMLEAGTMTLQGGTGDEFGGTVILTGTMQLNSNGDLRLQSEQDDDDKGGCKGSDTPPDFNSTDSSQVRVMGNFAIGQCAEVSFTSTLPAILDGNMQNQSTMPLGFEWDTGGLQMNGTNQTIEAAGEDRGPWPFGLEDNFAIGTLTLAANAVVQVVDEFDNQQDGLIACDEALYVDILVVSPEAVLLTDGCRVYYNELTNEGVVPGLGVDVLQILDPIAPDLDGNGEIDAFDLALFLGAWGPCPEPCVPGEPGNTCDADFDNDCVANAFDLAILLGSWGPVP